MSNSSIWPIDKTLSSVTTQGQSGPGSWWQWRGNPCSLKLQYYLALPSDCLVSYPQHSFGESYSFAEKQSMYSAAPANWATAVLHSLLKHEKGCLFDIYNEYAWKTLLFHIYIFMCMCQDSIDTLSMVLGDHQTKWFSYGEYSFLYCYVGCDRESDLVYTVWLFTWPHYIKLLIYLLCCI